MSALMPTSFGKGLLISLLYTFLWIVLGSVLFVIFIVVSLALHLLG